MIVSEAATTGAVVQATHSGHESMILTVGIIVWAVGAIFIGVGIAERRGLFRRRASVTFSRWASVVAAGLSLGAAAIHFSVIGVHYAEYPPHGVLFAALAWAQAAWAVAYLVQPMLRLALVAVALNASVVAVWALSRTVGLPYGPAPFVPEPVGTLDLLATSFELALVVSLAVVLSGRVRSVRLVPGIATAYAGSAIAVLVVVTSASLAAGGHEHDAADLGHSHEPATATQDERPTFALDPTAVPTSPGPSGPARTSVVSSPTAIGEPTPPTSSVEPAATPVPVVSTKPPGTSAPIGSIRFGSGFDVAGTLQPAEHFHAGETALWIARFTSPPATGELRFVVLQVLADGREFEHWSQAIAIEDPSALTLVGMADLATYAHGGAGTHRMRYLRGDDILAEGMYQLAP